MSTTAGKVAELLQDAGDIHHRGHRIVDDDHGGATPTRS
jgi:hypothetical protein